MKILNVSVHIVAHRPVLLPPVQAVAARLQVHRAHHQAQVAVAHHHHLLPVRHLLPAEAGVLQHAGNVNVV